MTKKIDNLNLFIKFLNHLGIKVTGVSAMGKHSASLKMLYITLTIYLQTFTPAMKI